jgi:signal transduction histidine kinase/ActR/RegA family two-component response regulator
MSLSPSAGRGTPTPPFLAGGGEAGGLMRTIGWSATAVGEPAAWPAALKTAVGILLRSRHPMFLWWGPDLVQFYNDAYTPSFGIGKHPAAMGQRGRDCWQEIWPLIWPQIDDVMSRGIASWNEDQLVPIFRNRRIEEVYWTYGYSPVLDDDGEVGGTLVVCTETTNRVLASRRLESLRALSEAVSMATGSDEILSRSAGVLAEANQDIPFALIYDADASARADLCHVVGLPPDPAAALDAVFRPRLSDLATTGHVEPVAAAIAPVVPPWPEPVAHAYVVPIGPEGGSVVGYLLLGLSPRLPFNEAYAQYLRQVGDQVAHGFARTEALRIRALVEGERNQLLEQAPVATALLTGPHHVFRLANPLFRQIVGRQYLVGRPYLEAFPELRGAPLPGILDRVYQTGQPFATNEMPILIDRSGSGTPEECYFNFNLEPIRGPSGAIEGMMAVAVDMTPQVLARKDLERAQSEREQLLQELEAASRAKDEFLAMLGHELRNPLSPILTALQLMQLRGIRGGERERAVIERQMKHVVGLVDDLLDMSRITRGRLELKRSRLRLADVVVKAIEQANPLIDQRRHRLRVDVPADLWVDGDAGRLAQVFANLLTNAAKYTESGGDITVSAAREAGQVVVHVADTGIGIAPEMLPHVFDAFTQERQRSDRPQGGLGLGLAIVKSLVEGHGGTVAIHSSGLGHGTDVSVHLPATTGDQPAEEAVAAQQPELSGRAGFRVLLVDDNEDAVTLLGDSLGALGHDVTVVFDASAALALADRYVPDLALLDLGLPIIDGHELAQRLRAQPGWQQVRFAALTGYGQAVDRERSQSAGFEAHLVKPIDVHDVDAAIRRLGGPDGPPD